jgi:hypothetical protein
VPEHGASAKIAIRVIKHAFLAEASFFGERESLAQKDERQVFRLSPRLQVEIETNEYRALIFCPQISNMSADNRK